ncbi:MAG: hypothetical protein ACRESI_08775 [Gammaproteobacteria bacterium]
MHLNLDIRQVESITPAIIVRWHFLAPKDSDWQSIRCLYAYVAPNKKEILYIGKSWGVTVKRRWVRDAKRNFWNDLEKNRKIKNHFVLLGDLALTYGGRLTEMLLADVESLLIICEQPWGNIQSKQSRIARHGLIVQCSGSWPGQAKFYQDNE